ncbi:hypothetical protein KAK07_11905 [Ideonella sp. 4Y16]|uniref:hypothetical protein n=1 Tax=Ideonella alba TaxID=2824118 RepID=UPI001B35D826|nr:hypothetical protein [Ideonella alba]MBQ0944039.1 hypothetical protein [Ideonella alba]
MLLLAACSPVGPGTTDAATPPVTDAAAAGIQPTAVTAAPAAPDGRFEAPEIEAAVQRLEQQIHPAAACHKALDALERGQADPDAALEDLCRSALAEATDPDAAALAARYRSQVRSELASELWAAAALAGDASAWLGLARQLDADAGAPDADTTTLDLDILASAQAAAQRAVDLGVPDAPALLARLQDREFPLAGARLEPLWRAIYFGDFDRIPDTIDNRRHVAGFTLGVIDICSRWEVGVRTVSFDAALETYLAPVRSQVLERSLQAVPKVGRTLAESAGQARDGAAERNLSGWIEQGLRAFQATKREVRNAVAIGSSDGRHAGQQLFNTVQSCRNPRGMKMLDALGAYFRHMHDKSPLRPMVHAATQSRPNAVTRQQD